MQQHKGAEGEGVPGSMPEKAGAHGTGTAGREGTCRRGHCLCRIRPCKAGSKKEGGRRGHGKGTGRGRGEEEVPGLRAVPGGCP